MFSTTRRKAITALKLQLNSFPAFVTTRTAFCSSSLGRVCEEKDDSIQPIKCDGKHYVPNPEYTGTRPRIKEYDYIDSGTKFVNFHSPNTGVAYSSDLSVCNRVNNLPQNKLKFIWMPNLLQTGDMDMSVFDMITSFFENEYPLSGMFRDLFGREKYNWILGNSRIVAPRNDLSHEEKQITHLVFSGVVLHDDVSEELLNLDDSMAAFNAMNHNMRRILAQQEESIPRINLSAAPSFPKELLPLADFFERYYSDLAIRILRCKGQEVLNVVVQAWDHFQAGVASEPQLCKDAAENNLHKYTENGILGMRSRSIGATLANAPGCSSFCAKHLQVEDPILRMCEMALTCEADMSTCYKEWAENERVGRVVNVNTADWHRQVLKLDVDETVTCLINKRNNKLKILIDALSHIEPRHRLRYWVAIRSILIFNDYSYRAGRDQDNNRYGWYAAPMTPDEYSNILPHLTSIGKA